VILRIFTCITIPEDRRKILGEWLSARKKDMPDVRWVRPETMHLTLKFCGEIQEDMALGMMRHLEKRKQKGAFQLTVEETRGFPSLSSPRVVCASVGGDMRRLKEVQYEAETAALRVGIDRDARAYSPHLTLGRRTAQTKLTDRQREILEENPISAAPWYADSITLMKSELFPSGPKYTPLGVFKI
jgi:2'-5' RNA ligase